MKTIALCAGCGAVAFLAMSYQMGLFEEPAWPDGEPAQAAAEVSATARPSFPEDLAPACSGKPVARRGRIVPVPSLIHWPSSMAAGSCTPRGSNGLVRNVHVWKSASLRRGPASFFAAAAFRPAPP